MRRKGISGDQDKGKKKKKAKEPSDDEEEDAEANTGGEPENVQLHPVRPGCFAHYFFCLFVSVVVCCSCRWCADG